MTNTPLDQRVAELLGWTWDGEDGCVWRDKYGCTLEGLDYSPSTNLTQAMGLWAEHCPVGGRVQIVLEGPRFNVCPILNEQINSLAYKFNHNKMSLPCATTEAWVEAKEEKK